jgi:hypothetical protein
MANIEVDGPNKTIKVDSGNLTFDIPGDIVLDADGANVTFKDGGTSVLDISNSSTDAVLTVSTQDKDLIIKGDDNGSAITAATFDMSDAGTLALNHDLRIADAGYIGSASDSDAIAIASNGVVTFSQAPVFPDGSVAVADLDIDGATDIGAAIVDADLFIIDDGAGGTNRKVTASRIKTYAGASGDITTIDSILKADVKIGEDDETKIDFETANEIHFYADNAEQVYVADGIFGPQTDNDVDLGADGVEWKDGWFDGTVTADAGLFDTLGITSAKDLGTGIHVKTSDSGGSVSTDSDEIVLESSGIVGMTMLAGTGSDCCIDYGDSGGSQRGRFIYAHNGDNMMWHTAGAERMRIEGDGDFKYGTTGDFGGTRFHIKLAFNSGRGLGLNSSDGASGGGLVPMIYFGVEDSAQGAVNAGGGSVQYNTSSDYRRKENVTNLTGAIDRVKTLKPYRFNFTDDPSKKVRDGFFAHEVDAIVPEAVSGKKDEVQTYREGQDMPIGKSVGDNILDKDGNTIPEYQGLDHSKLVPVLTAAMQELEARVKTLEDA